MNHETLLQSIRETREASRSLSGVGDEQLSAVIVELARLAREQRSRLLAANREDLDRMDPADPRHDRLLLDEQRIEAICEDLEQVASLDSPLGQVQQHRRLDNGLDLRRVSVPLGVVAVIFESRPNVTFDVFALCLKSGNACVLKGSRDAAASNKVIVQLIHEALANNGMATELVCLTPAEREALPVVLDAVGLIDVAIPRGSQGLIDFVRRHARIPVIETGAGVVHTYVDASADESMAEAVVFNSKTRRVSVCNALDTLLLHREKLPVLPKLLERMGRDHGVTVHADRQAFEALEGNYPARLERAKDEDFGREFLSLAMAVKVVPDLEAALAHIARHSSRHSEAVIAQDEQVIDTFLMRVDSAAVYANASTAFTDGGQFGMGAEIGISTQKLHARGPMALPELTSYKWVVRGTGQTRS
ncbi:MAG: glutamate-5-semialdehyde dehydrogenase [Xanthomonadales bacterium]|nr:glutamate-5-semialdehyde dehydrogenase [Xanthomonadales bacterium]